MKRPSLFHLNVEEFERRYLQGELEKHGWNRCKTARELGLSYRGILYLIDRLGLVAPDKEEFSVSA